MSNATRAGKKEVTLLKVTRKWGFSWGRDWKKLFRAGRWEGWRWDEGVLAGEGNWCWLSAPPDSPGAPELCRGHVGDHSLPTHTCNSFQAQRRGAPAEKTGEKETEMKRDGMAFGSVPQTPRCPLCAQRCRKS